MAVKNTAQVVIGGKIITLGGYESEEYFQKVASYINNKIAELSEMPGYSRQPMETKHTLLSLNITDDYFKAKKQAEIFEQDLQPVSYTHPISALKIISRTVLQSSVNW